MRPVLKPALRRVWRDGSTLQIGIADRSVILAGLDRPARRFVESLDGTGDLEGVVARARAEGLADAEAARLLGLLADVLQDGAAESRPLGRLTPEERDRLAPDVAALSLLAPEPDGGVAALARRRAASILIVGAGRIGGTLAAVLAAAGVGTIVADDESTARPADFTPAGLGREALGQTRGDATGVRLQQTYPQVRTRLRARTTPDIAVITGANPQALETADDFVQRGIPHLFAEVRETLGLVGPLVLPGQSACLRCVELARTERDPAWPRVVAQLASGRTGPEACDVALATLVAAQAAGQVLALLDGDHLTRAKRGDPATPPRSRRELPGGINGTLETSALTGLARRRSWAQHPLCGCDWSERSGDEPLTKASR